VRTKGVIMSYEFTFDLSKISQSLFSDISEFTQKGRVHLRMGNMARTLVNKFNIAKLTGLPVADSITVIEDLIDVQTKNNMYKKHFIKSNKRAVFLPHCCRKHMDSKCKAKFDPETTSYICSYCSEDCIVCQATKIAKKENYDVYVLPGASCVRNILKNKSYDGIVGVACTDELRLASKILNNVKIPGQAIPLIKNGCSRTQFNLETFKQTIHTGNGHKK